LLFDDTHCLFSKVGLTSVSSSIYVILHI